MNLFAAEQTRRVCVERGTDGVVGPQVEQVRGQDGRSEEPQEDEAAHGRVSDILVNCRAEKNKSRDFIFPLPLTCIYNIQSTVGVP